MALGSDLLSEIVTLLTPFMVDIPSRLWCIRRAFGTHSDIESKVKFDDPTNVFTTNLVTKLNDLDDHAGQNALITLLASLTSEVSKARHDLLKALIEQVQNQNTPSRFEVPSPTEQPGQFPKSPTKRSSRDIPQGVAVFIAAVITGFCALVAALIMQPTRLQETPTPVPTASATVMPTQPTVTVATSPTELPTATSTIAPATVMVTNAPPPFTESPTTTSLPMTTVAALSYVIHRSPDTIAVCPASAGDYGRLELYIGRNEVYTLGLTFPESAFAAANQCFCFQQENPQFPGPDVCDLINTATYPRVSDWRNQPITLRIDGRNVGSCPEESERPLYSCQIR